jgi:hypothetical protein
MQQSHRLKPKQKHYLDEDAMLMWRAYVCCGLLFSISMRGMEDKSWIGAAFHWIDKNVDPKPYVLDPETKKLSNEFLQFKWSAKNFNLDSDNLKTIARIFERQSRLLDCIEPHFASRKSEEVEDIFKKIDPNIVSHNLNAIMRGYLATILNKKKGELADLKKITGNDDNESDETSMADEKVILADVNADQLKSNKDRMDTNQLIADLANVSSFEKFIERRNVSYWQKGFNWARKKCFKDKYITHPDSLTISEGVLRFDPEHTNHWELNPSMPSHINAIHMAIEREKTLLYELEYYIHYKQHEPIMAIQKNTAKGYFSKVTLVAMNGYLDFATKEKGDHYTSSERLQQLPSSPATIECPFVCEVHESHISNLCKTASEFDKDTILDVKHEVQASKDKLKKVTLHITAKKTDSAPSLIETLTKTLKMLAENSKDPVDDQEKLKNNENILKESQDVKATAAASDHALNETQFLDINGKKVMQS